MKVIDEFRVQIGLESASIKERSSSMEDLGFIIDKTYAPIPLDPPKDGSVTLKIDHNDLYQKEILACSAYT